jgi:hypothetical protein
MARARRVLVMRPSKHDDVLRHLVARRFPRMSNGEIEDFLGGPAAVVATNLVVEEATGLVRSLEARGIGATAEIMHGREAPMPTSASPDLAPPADNEGEPRTTDADRSEENLEHAEVPLLGSAGSYGVDKARSFERSGVVLPCAEDVPVLRPPEGS